MDWQLFSEDCAIVLPPALSKLTRPLCTFGFSGAARRVLVMVKRLIGKWLGPSHMDEVDVVRRVFGRFSGVVGGIRN